MGIIPALAGNTSSWVGKRAAMRDHPRSRGEYVIPRAAQTTESGSSPLSRGIRASRPAVIRRVRIIPALAGNTSWDVFVNFGAQDHPRSRGEYPLTHHYPCRANGSSPLSRGIPQPRGAQLFHTGIIPALAGNTGPQRP